MYELNIHVCIVSIEDHCSSARPPSGPSKRRNDHGYETEGRTFTTRQEPEVGRSSKSVSRSATKKEAGASKRAQPKTMAGARSATKSQSVPAKTRSSAGSRTAARSTSGRSGSRSATRTRSASRPQGSLLNPMAWLSSLETTLTSPQARAVMAEALRAVANVLEKPQGSGQGQGSGTQAGQGRCVRRRKSRRRDRCGSAGGRSGCYRSRRRGRNQRPWRVVGRGPRQWREQQRSQTDLLTQEIIGRQLARAVIGRTESRSSRLSPVRLS